MSYNLDLSVQNAVEQHVAPFDVELKWKHTSDPNKREVSISLKRNTNVSKIFSQGFIQLELPSGFQPIDYDLHKLTKTTRNLRQIIPNFSNQFTFALSQVSKKKINY